MSSSTAIAPGSTILVTGGAGFVGSAIVNQLLQQGFKVKATTRSASKLEAFIKKADKQFGTGSLEAIEVKDLSQPGALDASLKGVSGVLHVASDMSYGDDLDQIVGGVVSMTQEVLKSVKRAESVKSFVLTSSRIAAFHPDGKPQRVDSSTWFDEAETLARNEKDDPLKKKLLTYAASKVAGEKALWTFVQTEKPHFRANSILPDLNFGKIHNLHEPLPGNYSSASMLLNYAAGEFSFLPFLFPVPCYFVDVDDSAKIHVATLLDDSIANQRMWAAPEKYYASIIQDTVKEIRPEFEEKDVSQYPNLSDMNIVIEDKASIDLLEKHYGVGFKSLKQSIKDTLLQ